MTIELHIGASGMGKTHAMVRLVEAHAALARAPWTCVFVDPKREWGRHSARGIVVAGPEGAKAALRKGVKILIWRAKPGIGNAVDVDAVCRFVLARGAGTLLAMPEAHLHFPLMRQPSRPCTEVLTGYRHRGLKVILDTQRLVSLSMMARNNLTLARVFGTVGNRDLNELTEMGGQPLAHAAIECARRARAGKSGFFVEYDAALAGVTYANHDFKRMPP